MEQDLFSVWDYAKMVACEPRTRPYVQALKRYVKPRSTVIDIGAGTGFFSLLACQYGASRVIAIEPNDEIQLAKEAAKDNGYDDRIEFYKGFSQDYAMDAKADIIISDLRGAMPLYGAHIPAIIDARQRLLKPQGTLIPKRDVIHVALARVDEEYRICNSLRGPNQYGVDMSSSHKGAINSPRWFFSKPEHIVSDTQIFADIKYETVESPNFVKKLSFAIQESGPANGLVMWFDAEIASGLSFSNAPTEPVRQYRSQFLPFESELNLTPEDRVEIKLSAQLIGGKYVWSWDTKLLKAGAASVQSSFKQSSFMGGVWKSG